MKNPNLKKHLVYWISGGLIMSFLMSLTGTFFPAEGYTQTLLYKMDDLFAISAFACLASKATSENFDIGAAGFTVLTIAQSLFLAEIDQPGNWNFETSNTAVLFLIPAMFLISYYYVFPKWLRSLGIISLIPFIILFILRTSKGFETTFAYELLPFTIYHFLILCWAWQIWKKRNDNMAE
jgi:hypothetical protein